MNDKWKAAVKDIRYMVEGLTRSAYIEGQEVVANVDWLLDEILDRHGLTLKDEEEKL